MFDGIHFDRLSFIWKHGFPNININKLNDKVVVIFILRNLEEWLLSMWDNPYYLKEERCCFNCFLTKKQYSSITKGSPNEIYDYYTGAVINESDENKTIFEIRYEKIESYLKYYRENENVWFVNLKYLENEENCKNFLKTLFEKYEPHWYISNLTTKLNIHTKDGLSIINRHENINFDEEVHNIINRYKIDAIEKWVNKLTFEFK